MIINGRAVTELFGDKSLTQQVSSKVSSIKSKYANKRSELKPC